MKMNEIKRLFRLGVLLMVIAIMASCSKNDYKLIVPSNCTALMSVDLSQLSATGIGQKIGSLLMVDNADNSGIDFKSKLYLFETTDGDMGVCASIDSKSDFTDMLESLAKKGNCTRITKRHDINYALLRNSWLVGFDDSRVVLIGPITPSQQTDAMQTVRKYFGQDEEHSMLVTRMYERLDAMESPVGLVCRVDALPEKIALPFLLGAPKDADASQVMVTATIRNEAETMIVEYDTYSDNARIDESLNAARTNFRQLGVNAFDRYDSNSALGLFLDVNGSSFLPYLQNNKATQSLLAGINTIIDIDNILRSVDGELVVSIPKVMNNDNVSQVRLMAKLASLEWMKDIDYWKKSCPSGASISDVGSRAYCCSNGNMKFYFGVTPKQYFVSGNDASDAVDGDAAVSAQLPQSVKAQMAGHRLALVLNVKSVIGNDNKGVEQIIGSLLGDVRYICCVKK